MMDATLTGTIACKPGHIFSGTTYNIIEHNPRTRSIISSFTDNIRKAYGLLMDVCSSPSWGSCVYNVRAEGYNPICNPLTSYDVMKEQRGC